MSLAVIGAALVVLSAIAFALNMGPPDSDTDRSKSFESMTKLYRARKEAFRNDESAMAELAEWKKRNDGYKYKALAAGLIPSGVVARPTGPTNTVYRSSDTWFSEFEGHNDRALILSESPESYIIGNLASYDKRQYPTWFKSSFIPGENTPEGQGFGHCLIIPKQRIFNIVDPAAVANDCELLKEMKSHFIEFWQSGGKSTALRRTRDSFDEQNQKLQSNSLDNFRKLLPDLQKDFETFSRQFVELEPSDEDFEFGFHAWPDNSVGHLHMHVFPKKAELRHWSTKIHDKKTIPLEAVLEVEREDADRAKKLS